MKTIILHRPNGYTTVDYDGGKLTVGAVVLTQSIGTFDLQAMISTDGKTFRLFSHRQLTDPKVDSKKKAESVKWLAENWIIPGLDREWEEHIRTMTK